MGRRWVTQPDGRQTLGYRKTLRQNPRLRTDSAAPQQFRLVLTLPPSLAWSMTQGQLGSVEIGAKGQVSVLSYDSGLVVDRMAEFLGKYVQPGSIFDAVRQGSHGGRVNVKFQVTPSGVVVSIANGRPKLIAMKRTA